MPNCADTDKQKISQYWWLPISEPIISATLPYISNNDSWNRVGGWKITLNLTSNSVSH